MSLLTRLVFNSPVKLCHLNPEILSVPYIFKYQKVSTLSFSRTRASCCCYVGNNHWKTKSGLQVNAKYLRATQIQYFSSSSVEKEDLGELVYQGRIGSMFRALKIFSLSTSAIGLCLQPYLLMTYQDTPLKLAIPMFAVLNVFVFVNPILIHFIAKKYVLEMYFNTQTKVFTAILLTFFARKEKISFTADDVDCPDVPNMFAMFTAKGRPLFAHEADFTSLEVYKHLMGFDVPLDLTKETKNH
ncbi:transmembrane protein 70 mitochondrial [Biomphalaria glabrata]|nr:transmembrane protein 70, mitochondrial [Biomphalaria glabrata]KAI8761940.1 transmembrane protein 70-like protein; mitochondrial-like [Biomphalaria glabrata]